MSSTQLLFQLQKVHKAGLGILGIENRRLDDELLREELSYRKSRQKEGSDRPQPGLSLRVRGVHRPKPKSVLYITCTTDRKTRAVDSNCQICIAAQ